MFDYARELPIYDHLDALTGTIWSHESTLVKALPGAGKTTCLPLALLETMPSHNQSSPQIVVVQPRRVAAKLAAHRCSELLGTKLGGPIGYQVRDEVCVSDETQVLFTTAGTFIQLLAHPRGLHAAIVLLDEFHERSLEMDLALAWLKRVSESSKLRCVVMSATLDIEALKTYLNHPPSFEIPGRTFPVDISYAPRRAQETLSSALLRVCRDVINAGELGAGLVFLPGKGEIESAIQHLEPSLKAAGWSCVALHGQLPLEEQRRVVAANCGKRVVLSTNIAETSLTLKDVTWVVDSGEVRRLRWDLETGFESLLLESISKASAEQRAGRAGRVRAGRCIRLFSSAQWNHLSHFDPASVLREDILSALMRAMGLGLSIRDWLTPPTEAALNFSTTWLDLHQLRDSETELTALGRKVLGRPMSLREALFVYHAEERGLRDAALLWVALWQEPPPRRLTLSDTSAASDCEAWLSARPDDLMSSQRGVWRGWQERLRHRFKTLGGKKFISDDIETLRWAAAMTSPDRIGFMSIQKDGTRSIQITTGRRLEVDESVVVRREGWVVVLAARQQKTVRGLRAIAQMVAEIEEDWLVDLPGDRLQEDIESSWDESLGKLRSFEILRYGVCVLSKQPIEARVTAESHLQVTKALERRGLHAYFGDDAVESLVSRLEIAHRSGLRLEDSILESLPTRFESVCVQAVASRLTDLEELKGTDLLDWVFPDNAWEIRQTLERLVPLHCELPSGRRLKIKYERGRSPFISSYLQEFFGMSQTPMLGSQPLTIELWAPNGRPIQVTSDLTGFWDRHYAELAKSLRRRYPKHYWPEDPKTAKAERFKRRVHE